MMRSMCTMVNIFATGPCAPARRILPPLSSMWPPQPTSIPMPALSMAFNSVRSITILRTPPSMRPLTVFSTEISKLPRLRRPEIWKTVISGPIVCVLVSVITGLHTPFLKTILPNARSVLRLSRLASGVILPDFLLLIIDHPAEGHTPFMIMLAPGERGAQAAVGRKNLGTPQDRFGGIRTLDLLCRDGVRD